MATILDLKTVKIKSASKTANDSTHLQIFQLIEQGFEIISSETKQDERGKYYLQLNFIKRPYHG